MCKWWVSFIPQFVEHGSRVEELVLFVAGNEAVQVFFGLFKWFAVILDKGSADNGKARRIRVVGPFVDTRVRNINTFTIDVCCVGICVVCGCPGSSS